MAESRTEFTDALPWPPGYRALYLWLSAGGAVVVALSLAWRSLAALPLALVGLLMAGACLAIWRTLGRQPMLAIDATDLHCVYKAGHARRSAEPTRLRRVPIADIEAVEREVQPWPGKGGERHVYWLHRRDGTRQGLVPKPADAATREAMAAFFGRHFADRVREHRLG